jgi:uncharacterized protein YdaU (DUF1376 family)
MKDKKDKIYYFQEKSNDILDLQDDLTTEEIGIYFILKAGYYKYSGELTKENIYQRCKFFGDKAKMDLMVSKIFDLQDELLINNNWLSEINGIKQISKKRKEIAEKRWSEEALKEEKKTKKTKNKQELSDDGIIKEQLLPNFIDRNLFNAFVEMRVKIKKPLTEVATDLLIKKLIKFESKQVGLANQALENSIESSYQGVFEPKINNSTQKPTGMPKPRYDDPDYYKNDGGWND